MLCLKSNASGNFLQKYINFVEQQLKFSHFRGGIIPSCTKQFGNWNFLSFVAFIFCQIERIVLQVGYRYWVGEPIFVVKQFCGSLSAGNTVYKLKWG